MYTFYVCVCVAAQVSVCVPRCICGAEGTTCMSQIFSPITWDLGTELWSPGGQQGPLPVIWMYVCWGPISPDLKINSFLNLDSF